MKANQENQKKRLRREEICITDLNIIIHKVKETFNYLLKVFQTLNKISTLSIKIVPQTQFHKTLALRIIQIHMKIVKVTLFKSFKQVRESK